MSAVQVCTHCKRPLTDPRTLPFEFCRPCLSEWQPPLLTSNIHTLLEQWFVGVADGKSDIPPLLLPGANYHKKWAGFVVSMVSLPIVWDLPSNLDDLTPEEVQHLQMETSIDQIAYDRLKAVFGHLWATYALNAFKIPPPWRFSNLTGGRTYAVVHLHLYQPGQYGYLEGYRQPYSGKDIWHVQRRINERALTQSENKAWRGLRLRAPIHSGAERKWSNQQQFEEELLQIVNRLRNQGLSVSKITRERAAEEIGLGLDGLKENFSHFGVKWGKLKRQRWQ